jgi:hypothetical protein
MRYEIEKDHRGRRVGPCKGSNDVRGGPFGWSFGTLNAKSRPSAGFICS